VSARTHIRTRTLVHTQAHTLSLSLSLSLSHTHTHSTLTIAYNDPGVPSLLSQIFRLLNRCVSFLKNIEDIVQLTYLCAHMNARARPHVCMRIRLNLMYVRVWARVCACVRVTRCDAMYGDACSMRPLVVSE
jgi:hypothetical protein